MTRWFRWSYVGPRLILALALLVLSEMGVARLLQRAVRQGGEAAIGARVEVKDAEASLLGTHAALTGLTVADPRDPMTNLLEADTVGLDFDAGSALRKKLVVKQGVVRGLRFATPRETSGALPQQDKSEGPGGFDLQRLAGAQAAQRWLGGVQERLSTDLQSDLESVRLAREMRHKWPAEYQRIAAEANELKQSVETLRSQIAEARENPLRNVHGLHEAAKRISELQERFAALSRRMAEIPEEVAADRRAALAACEHDERVLREKLAIENIDAESLGAYLVGERVAAPVSELVGWVRWARSLSTAKASRTSERSRGADVLFAGCRPMPSVLIESLRLEGSVRVSGAPLGFRGRLTDLTTEPDVHGRPVRLTLATTGVAPMRVEATFDRTGPAPRDELVAHCPAFPLREVELGDKEKFAIKLAPGSAELLVHVALSGDRLAGDIRLVQPDASATPHVKLCLGDLVAARDLQRALSEQLEDLPELSTRVTLAGELQRPEWRLTSNAGAAVAEALQTAARGAAEDRAQRAVAAAQRTVQQQLVALDHEVAHVAAQIRPAVDGPTGALQALAAELKRIPTGMIGGRTAPLGSLLK